MLHYVAVVLSTCMIGFGMADNPIVQDRYTADPAPMLYDDRLFLFTSHDEDGSTDFNMIDWQLFSTDDMANWQHHGSPAGLYTFAWADQNAWAPQAIERNGKFYLYVPIRRSGGGMSIGVGISDSIFGPYQDAIGGPLVENAEIDPTVFIDDDGQAYLYWGNPNLWYVTLNEDMISYSGELNQVDLTVAGFGNRDGDESTRPTAYEEGPWLFKRNETYYLLYAANCCSEDLRYATSPTVTGPWQYGGRIMGAEGSFTNHPGYIEYKGRNYFFYHTGALEGGGSYTRSVAVEWFEFGDDGSIPEIAFTTEGPAQIDTLDPFVQQEAETIAWSSGIEIEACSEGGFNVANIENGDYIKVQGADFTEVGPTIFQARVASGSEGGSIELRLGSQTGELIATCDIGNTGGWQRWATISCPVSGVANIHDLYFVYIGGDGFLFNVNWWKFE